MPESTFRAALVRVSRYRSVLVLIAGLLAIACLGEAARSAPPASSAEARSSAKSTKPFVPDRLLRPFRGKREDLRHRALDEAEQQHLADPQLAPTLWQVIEPALKTPRVPDSLLRAARLYGRLTDPESATRLLILLDAGDLRVVLAAIDILAERRPATALDRLTKLPEHPAYRSSFAFRHAVVSAVARFQEPAGVAFLVTTVGSSDGQLKYEAVRHLIRQTGENFGGQAGDWKKWWAANRDGFRPVPATAKAGTATRTTTEPAIWDYDLPKFFGIPIYGKRVVFVIDKSKSMLSSVDGVSRLDTAEKELEGALRQLPDDAWFEIIAYNDSEQRFAGKLVEASASQKSGAVRFIYSLMADRTTDIYDTLADALQLDENIETILFLSDGIPTSGSVVDPSMILQSLSRQNATLRVSINVIGIDAQGAAGEFLKNLALDNFGVFQVVR